MALSASTRAMLTQFREQITEHGWIVTGIGDSSDQCVGGCGHHHTGPARAQDPRLYTAGLTVAGLPELLLEHVPTGVAARVLNALARYSLAAELKPGVAYPVGAQAYTVTPLEAREGLRLCGIARHMYGHTVRVLRVAEAPAGEVLAAAAVVTHTDPGAPV